MTVSSSALRDLKFTKKNLKVAGGRTMTTRSPSEFHRQLSKMYSILYTYINSNILLNVAVRNIFYNAMLMGSSVDRFSDMSEVKGWQVSGKRAYIFFWTEN